MAPKTQNKHVIHLPALPLLCLMPSCRILPLWVDCLHHCWSVPGCSSITLSSLSANCFYLAASWHLSQESRASRFCCFAKIFKLTSLYSEQFCPELMQFLTYLRIPRIKPLSLGRGRFSRIISNSSNHHGSRKRDRVLLSERIYRLEARTQGKIPSSLPSSTNTS